MDEIRIDQLRLQLPGLTEQDGRRLVRLISEALAEIALPRAVARPLGALRITVGAEHRSVEAISQHVVAEVVRQLQTTAGEAGAQPRRAPEAAASRPMAAAGGAAKAGG